MGTDSLVPALVLLIWASVAELEADSSRMFSFLNPAPQPRRIFFGPESPEWLSALIRLLEDVRVPYLSPSTFVLITCSLDRLRYDMGPVPDPFFWASIFISKMREKLIHIFQHLFCTKSSVLSTSCHCEPNVLKELVYPSKCHLLQTAREFWPAWKLTGVTILHWSNSL